MGHAASENNTNLINSEQLIKSLEVAFRLAPSLGHQHVLPAHLLLAFLQDSDILFLINAYGVDLEETKEEILKHLPPVQDSFTGSAQLAAPTASIIEHAAQSAIKSGHRELDSTIVFAAIMSDKEASVTKVLANHDLDVGSVEEYIKLKVGKPISIPPLVQKVSEAEAITQMQNQAQAVQAAPAQTETPAPKVVSPATDSTPPPAAPSQTPAPATSQTSSPVAANAKAEGPNAAAPTPAPTTTKPSSPSPVAPPAQEQVQAAAPVQTPTPAPQTTTSPDTAPAMPARQDTKPIPSSSAGNPSSSIVPPRPQRSAHKPVATTKEHQPIEAPLKRAIPSSPAATVATSQLKQASAATMTPPPSDPLPHEQTKENRDVEQLAANILANSKGEQQTIHPTSQPQPAAARPAPAVTSAAPSPVQPAPATPHPSIKPVQPAMAAATPTPPQPQAGKLPQTAAATVNPSPTTASPNQKVQQKPARTPHISTPHRQGATISATGSVIERGRLNIEIPSVMRAGDSQIIRIHLQRNRNTSEVNGGETADDQIVTEALTVQLKAPADNFHIEPLRPETNWLDQKTRHIGDGAYGKWKWKVRPLKRGPTQLKLVVSARTLDEAGNLSEAVLPDQMIDVKVSSNFGKFIIMGATTILIAGIGSGLFYFYPILKHLF